MPKPEVKPQSSSSRATDRRNRRRRNSTPRRTSTKSAAASKRRFKRKSKDRRSPWPKLPRKAGGKVIDLMEALRASLEKTEAAQASTSKLGPRKAPKRVEQAGEGRSQGDQASGTVDRRRRDAVRSDAFLQRAGRRTSPAPVAQYHSWPDQRRLRQAGARSAARVPFFVSGPDRAACRARADRRQGLTPPHQPLARRSAPAPARDPCRCRASASAPSAIASSCAMARAIGRSTTVNTCSAST